MNIELIDNFRERRVADEHIEYFRSFTKNQWNYFNQTYDYEFWKTIEMPDNFLLSFSDKELEFIKNVGFD